MRLHFAPSSVHVTAFKIKRGPRLVLEKIWRMYTVGRPTLSPLAS